MDILLLVLCILNLVVLIIILIRLADKKDINVDEGALLHVKDELRRGNEESFSSFRTSLDRDLSRLVSDNRESAKSMMNTLSSMMTLLKDESENQNRRMMNVQKVLNENFDRIREDNRASFSVITEKNEKLTLEVKSGMDRIREGNEKKLGEIQGIVDNKLQETLDKRIASSFEAVTENLNKLYKALSTLDILSGDVKKMNSLFSNVKSRGVWGEMQAETILSDILTPEQWVKNYSPRQNRENVEFAIRLPGKGEGVYLPVDSKFPTSDLERYKEALESGNDVLIKEEAKKIKTRITEEAKDINKKYIVPPFTTDFAVLFIPSETLYLEALKMEGLVEKIQNESRVVLTGPNNFAALLNALSLGFRTMQIEEYTSTIWHLFEDLKKLFSDLSKSVDESKKHVDKASESLENVKRRKEKIGSVLKKMESSAEKAALCEIKEYYLEEENTEDDNG